MQGSGFRVWGSRLAAVAVDDVIAERGNDVMLYGYSNYSTDQDIWNVAAVNEFIGTMPYPSSGQAPKFVGQEVLG